MVLTKQAKRDRDAAESRRTFEEQKRSFDSSERKNNDVGR
jgi:hypothetical protein